MLIAEMTDQFLPFITDFFQVIIAKHGKRIYESLAGTPAEKINRLAIKLLNFYGVHYLLHKLVDIMPALKHLVDRFEVFHLLLQFIDFALGSIRHALNKNPSCFCDNTVVIN